MSDTGLRFEPFAPVDLSAWLQSSRAEYIGERMASGDTEAEAVANADRSFEQLFPAGTPAPGQLVGRVLDAGGDRVGQLWVGPAGSDPTRWWVWNIAVEESRRGQGLGRASMLLAEQLAHDRGAVTLGLNVFAHNEVARRLYQSLGYHETAVQMSKPLT